MEEEQISTELHIPRLLCPSVTCSCAAASMGWGCTEPPLCILGPLIITEEKMNCYSLLELPGEISQQSFQASGQ